MTEKANQIARDPGCTRLMGVINATIDSFSGDGILRDTDWQTSMSELCTEAWSAGIAVLDIGAESTRPGATRVDGVRERELIAEAVVLAKAAADLPVSIDTTRSSVAAVGCTLGATMINDVSGLCSDPEIADVAAEHRADLVLVHNAMAASNVEQGGRLGARSVPTERVDDIVAQVAAGLTASIQEALRRGVSAEQIWIDPGLGFGKTHNQNLELIARVNELRQVCPRLLVGPSRKSFIGWTLGVPPEDRVEGTAAVVAILAEQGVDLVRVHDYCAMSRVVKMTNAVVGQRRAIAPIDGGDSGAARNQPATKTSN